MSHDEHEGHYAWEVEPFDPEGPLGILISMSDVECGQILDVNTVILANGDSDEEIEWARSTAEEIAGRLNSIATLTAERDQLRIDLTAARELAKFEESVGDAHRKLAQLDIVVFDKIRAQRDALRTALEKIWLGDHLSDWAREVAREALGGKS